MRRIGVVLALLTLAPLAAEGQQAGGGSVSPPIVRTDVPRGRARWGDLGERVFGVQEREGGASRR